FVFSELSLSPREERLQLKREERKEQNRIVLVILRLLLPKPTLIPFLEQGDEPQMVERETRKGICPGNHKELPKSRICKNREIKQKLGLTM
ncbi:hypothetical protein MC885_001202, partial [Smutsia gigantea]